jgi:hypothetical protein
MSLPDSFSKSTQKWNFMKIRLVGAELFYAADRRTGMTKLMVTVRSLAKAPNEGLQFPDVSVTYVYVGREITAQ